MGFSIQFYKKTDPPRDRLNAIIDDLRRQPQTPKIQQRINAIERELYSNTRYKLAKPKLTFCNLTYNYSTPECIEYWYGRRDYNNTTVKIARETMRLAIERMEKDGIIPNELGQNYIKPTPETLLNDMLMWLKTTYSDLLNIDDDLIIILN